MEQIVGELRQRKALAFVLDAARLLRPPRRPKSPLSRARKKKHEPVDPYRH